MVELVGLLFIPLENKIRAYSFNGKTAVSKRVVPGSSPGGPANVVVLLLAPVQPASQFRYVR